MDNDLLHILFATPILKVLNFLLQNPESELNDTEIAERVEGTRKSAVNLALRKLGDLGIVSRTHRGRMVFNKLVDSALTRELKKTSNLMAVQTLIDELAPFCATITLFGSRATGEHRSESDFDLLFVTNDENRVRKVARKSMLAEKLQLIIKSPEQMLSFDDEEKVLSKEIRKGIKIWQRE